MKANDSEPYLVYLNMLVDEYDNTYHFSICKKPIDTGYLALTEEIVLGHKAPKFQVGDSVKISKYNNIFSKT